MTPLLAFTVVAAALLQTQESPLARGARHVRERDYKSAAAAFEEGVAAGDAACMDYLGFLYLEGLGKTPSPWIAYGYFRQAADLGNDQACRNLGNMYYGGRAVEPDLAAAAKWWEKSTKLGNDPRPWFSLAQLDAVGEGVTHNPARAKERWQRARKLGSDDAVVALAVFDSSIDRKSLEPLAAKGHLTARGALALLDMSQSKTAILVKDVSFVSQAHNFCALASSTMLLRNQGAKATQFDVARARLGNRWGEGSAWNEMVAVAGTYEQNWRVDSFPYSADGYQSARDALLARLKAGDPVIIDILENKAAGSAHSIVVRGHDPESGEFLAVDPALPYPGLRTFTESHLKTVWRSMGFLPTNRELRRPMMSVDRGVTPKSAK